MAKDEPNLKNLEALICSDVGLAAGLIALANSPFFSIRNRVRSVREALQLLGLAVAGRAIATLILRNVFPPTPALARFWDASARIARLSGWLTQGERIGAKLRPDEAYTFGLFRDCGIPVLLKRFPEYAEVLRKANGDKDGSFTAVEETVCRTNHAAVGCLLAQAWWLPEDLYLGIRHHHDYLQLKQDAGAMLSATTLRLIATTQLAEHLLQKHTGLSNTQEWHKSDVLCLELLNITGDRLNALYEESTDLATSPT
jgi:HD-like signal output (HDOD) protein